MYSCSGERSVVQGLRSADSSLRHNHVPHVMFASPEPSEQIDGLSVEPFEPSDNPYADKIANMRRAPFERTIYLDTDTFVLDEIVHVLELLDGYDLAVARAPGYRGLFDPEVPAAFTELNTGVVAWRESEETAAFLEDWHDTYVAWLQDEPFPGAANARGKADQPAFRRCAWKHRMRTMVLPPEYNYRTGVPGTVVGPVRVIHGRHSDYDAIAARLNETLEPRSIPAIDGAGNPVQP
jgi:hypothetical protein